MLINRKIVLSFDYLDFSINDEVKLNEVKLKVDNLSLTSSSLESIKYSDVIIIHKNDYMRLCSKIGTDSLNNELVKIFVKNAKIYQSKYDCKNPSNNKFSELKNSCVLRIGGYHNGDKRKIYCPEWVINKLELDNMIDDTQVKYINGRYYFREHFILPKCSLVHLKRIPEINTLKIKLNKEDGSYDFYQSLKDIYNSLEFEKEIEEIFVESLKTSYKCIQEENIIYFNIPSLNIYVSGFVSKMKVIGDEDISGYGKITSETKIII